MPEDKNKRPSSHDDSNLFKESMMGVTRLSTDKENLLAFKTKPQPHKKNLSSNDDQTILIHDTNDIRSDDVLFFSQQGIQHKLIRSLKAGKLDIDERIDLHGLTVQQAQYALSDFLDHQLEQAHRCISIVHGKGTSSHNNHPVLKNLVFNQLKAHPHVLAFSSSQIRDGGTGAVYVLLKNAAKLD